MHETRPSERAPTEPTGIGERPPVLSSWQQLQDYLDQVQQAADSCRRQMDEYIDARRAAEQRAAEQTRAAIAAQMQEREQAIQRQREAMERQGEELAEQHHRLETERGRIESAGKELQAERRGLDEQREALRRDREALEEGRAEIEQRSGQLETQHEALAEARREFDERVRQFERQRDELGGRIGEAKAQEEALRAGRQELDALQAQLDGEREQLEADRARCEQQAAQIEGARRELDDRETRLDQQHSRIEAEGRAHEQRRAELEEQAERVEAIRAELEAQREALEADRAALEQRESDFAATAQRAAADLKEQEQRLRAERDRQVAILDEKHKRHQRLKGTLERRRARLRKYKEAVRQKSDGLREQVKQFIAMRRAAQEILARRQSLAEVQRLMSDAEERMIRRWSVRAGLNTAVAMVICLILLLAISYAVGDKVAERRWVASAAVQHRVEDPAGGAEWAAQQRQLMLSEPVLKGALVLARQDGYANATVKPQQLRSRLEGALTVTAPRPGQLRLDLQGTERNELAPLLSGLSRAYAAHARNSAEAAGAVHVTQTAVLNPRPVVDNHLMVGGVIFGGGAVLMLALFVGGVWLFNRTSKRISDNIGFEALDDDAAWSGRAELLGTSSSAGNAAATRQAAQMSMPPRAQPPSQPWE